MQKLNLVHLIAGFHHLTMLKNLQQWSRMNRSLFWWCLVFCVIYECNALNNGVGVRPVMGFDTYNGFHGNYDSNFLEEIGRTLISSGLVNYGYNRVNIDGGWAYVIQNKTDQKYYTQRNATGFLYPGDPIKFPNGIDKTIKYIQSLGLKWGHYWNSGVNACGGAIDGGSENFMTQDISLFYSWNIDMIKVDDCGVEGNDTEIIFKWRDMLNATGRPIVFSDCRNQCMNDAQHGRLNWKPWCVNLTNSWRISTDINPGWGSVMHNLGCGIGFGKWAQPGAWTDLDILEVDVGNFHYNSGASVQRLMMNQAHFGLWCIMSSPLLFSINISTMAVEIYNVLTNKYALNVSQNYLDNGGDEILQFNITNQFKESYIALTSKNKNQTQLFYKPMPNNVGNAAFLYLNRNETFNYTITLQFNQLPFQDNHNNPLKCQYVDIWDNQTGVRYEGNEITADLAPMSCKFILLQNCTSQTDSK
eukprot:550393_1